MNNITIIGNVGKQPEIRFTPGGMAVGEMTVATTRGKDDKKQTTWHNVTVFGKLAENTAATVVKGSRVIVVGRIDITTSEKDGVKKTWTKIVADNVGPDLTYDSYVKDETEKVMAKVKETFNADLFDEDAF